MRIRYFFFGVIFSSWCFCERQPNEFWSGIEIQKEILPKLDVELGQDVRYKNNFREFHKMLTELSFSRQIFSFSELGIQYRYSIYDDKEKSRVSASIKFEKGFDLFSLDFRTKIQQSRKIGDTPENLVFRNRVKFDYGFKPNWEMSISAETYHHIQEDAYPFEKYRLSTGLIYDISASHAVEFFFIYESEIKNSSTDITPISGMKYEISI